MQLSYIAFFIVHMNILTWLLYQIINIHTYLLLHLELLYLVQQLTAKTKSITICLPH